MEGGVILTKATVGLTENQIEIAKNTGDAIPREPEKLKLKGHRAKVTRV